MSFCSQKDLISGACLGFGESAFEHNVFLFNMARLRILLCLQKQSLIPSFTHPVSNICINVLCKPFPAYPLISTLIEDEILGHSFFFDANLQLAHGVAIHCVIKLQTLPSRYRVQPRTSQQSVVFCLCWVRGFYVQVIAEVCSCVKKTSTLSVNPSFYQEHSITCSNKVEVPSFHTSMLLLLLLLLCLLLS